MAIDPRKNTFSVKTCPRQQQIAQNDNAGRKSFLDGIAKVGNLEVLNEVGFGAVGEGLRTLASVSDSIRTGVSMVPGRVGNQLFNTTLGKIANTARTAVDSGANVVLEAAGINPAAVSGSLNSLNPDVANRALGQAKDIYERVKDGNFELSDIPEVFSDLQNMETLARNIFSSGDAGGDTRQYERCSASPYAVDLIRYAPKFKFLFIVDFQLTPPYNAWGEYTREMAFVVKRGQRPSVEYEYEDVNMYNFRTKVPRRVNYPPLSLTFYDDNKNNAHLFYTAYMRAMSPIANMQMQGAQNNEYESRSMSFASQMNGTFATDGDPTTKRYASSLGPLNDNVRNVLSRIRMFHVFDYGRAMNIYNFYNPRITTFTPDDVNMAETGDGNEFEFQFDYDGMYIQPGWDTKEITDNINIKELTGGQTLFYPIDPVFASDDTSADRAQKAPTAQAQEAERTIVDEVTGLFDPITGLAAAGTGLLNSAMRQGSAMLNGIQGQANAALQTVRQQANGLAGAASGALSGVAGAVNSATRQAASAIQSRVAMPSNFKGSTFSGRTDTSRNV